MTTQFKNIESFNGILLTIDIQAILGDYNNQENEKSINIIEENIKIDFHWSKSSKKWLFERAVVDVDEKLKKSMTLFNMQFYKKNKFGMICISDYNDIDRIDFTNPIFKKFVSFIESTFKSHLI